MSKSSQNNGTGFCCAHPTGSPLEDEPAPDDARLLDPALLEPWADEDAAAALEDNGVAEEPLAANDVDGDDDEDDAPTELLAITLDESCPALELERGTLELNPAEVDDDDTATLEDPALLEDPARLVVALLDPGALLDVVVPPDEEEPPRTRHTPASHESDARQSWLLLQRSRQVPSTSVCSEGQLAAWVHATPQTRTVPNT